MFLVLDKKTLTLGGLVRLPSIKVPLCKYSCLLFSFLRDLEEIYEQYYAGMLHAVKWNVDEINLFCNS